MAYASRAASFALPPFTVGEEDKFTLRVMSYLTKQDLPRQGQSPGSHSIEFNPLCLCRCRSVDVAVILIFIIEMGLCVGDDEGEPHPLLSPGYLFHGDPERFL